MAVPARIGLITLACRGTERMARIVRAIGWPEAPSSDPDHSVFQTTNGAPLALYPAENYERVFGAIACETLRQVGDVELLGEPAEAFRGGGFSRRDPEGNVWDVAWAAGSTARRPRCPDVSLTCSGGSCVDGYDPETQPDGTTGGNVHAPLRISLRGR